MGYVTIPITVDPLDILQLAYDYIQTYFPNWKPSDGNLDTAILQSLSTDAASLRELATSVPDSIFRWYGATLMQLPPIDATAATTTVKITVQDNAGYTVPAGTQLSINDANGTPQAFETLTDTIIPVGNTYVDGILISAVTPGSAANGIGSINGPVALIDSLAYVSSITQDAVTTGGQDAESDQDYLNRLTAELQLMSPRLIIPSDFAEGAKTIDNVFRAIAIDGYDPTSMTYGNPREVTVACVDSSGNPVSTGTKTDVINYFAANREVNFIANVIDPTYTGIDVSFDVAALSGYDTAALVTSIETAINGWLSQAAWGQDPTVRDSSAAQTWIQSSVVRFTDLEWIIRSIEGVAYLKTVQMAIHGNALGTADINLPGAAPLTQPGTVTGTAE